jgi:hypothetical protein
MRMIFIGMAAAAMGYLLVGCAASISPLPGVEVGFDARPEALGGSISIDPRAAGCETAKAISWSWLENQVCPKDPTLSETP